MAKFAKYRNEYTFIKTPESDSDLELYIADLSDTKKKDTLSENSTNCLLVFNNNISMDRRIPPSTPSTSDFNSEKSFSSDYSYVCSQQKYHKLNNNIFNLKSKEILFSDVSGNCYTIYNHYTLNNLLIEQIEIIGELLNTTNCWIHKMITFALQAHYTNSPGERDFVQKLRIKSKELIKLQIINEINNKKICSLKKPMCWKHKLFIKYICKYFNTNTIIKIKNIYYIMIINKNNYYYAIAEFIFQKSDIIISCNNSLIIGEIYSDMLLNSICFTGWDSSFFTTQI